MGPERLSNTQNACACASKKSKIEKRNLPILFTIIIAILPKCPFCIIAYSSAITMCSGQKWYDHSPTAASYISIGFAFIILLSILFNYRDHRTWIAAGLAIIGGGLVGYAELYTGELFYYNIGTGLLLIAALLNGSLIHFARRLFFFIKGKTLNFKVSEN